MLSKYDLTAVSVRRETFTLMYGLTRRRSIRISNGFPALLHVREKNLMNSHLRPSPRLPMPFIVTVSSTTILHWINPSYCSTRERAAKEEIDILLSTECSFSTSASSAFHPAPKTPTPPQPDLSRSLHLLKYHHLILRHPPGPPPLRPSSHCCLAPGARDFHDHTNL